MAIRVVEDQRWMDDVRRGIIIILAVSNYNYRKRFIFVILFEDCL